MLGFGAKVKAYDIYENKELSKLEGFSYSSLDEIYKDSDIISLHCPLNDSSYHLIDNQSISKMKDGVFIVNSSRGGLINTSDMIEGLKSKKIAGAALDVYEEESEYFFQDKSADIISDDVLARLLTFNNVLITSHQAFLTEEALSEIAKVSIDNIKEFLNGKRNKQLTSSKVIKRASSYKGFDPSLHSQLISALQAILQLGLGMTILLPMLIFLTPMPHLNHEYN